MRRSLPVLALVLAVSGAALAQSPSGYLGLVAKPVTRDVGRALGLGPGEGAQVVEVVPNGPAAAGVRVGDVVVAIDGAKVEGPDALAAHVTTRRPGMTSVLEIARGRARLLVRVVLGAPRSGPSRSDVPKAVGASVRS